MFRRTLLLAAALVALGACATEAPETSADPSADEARLRADAPVWFDLYNRGDANGVANLYAEDGVIMPPGGQSTTGRDAIRSFLTSDIANTKAGGFSTNAGEITGVGIDGDMAWMTGTFSVTDAAGTTVDTGKYLSLYRRINSEWKLIRDIWNSDSAPAAPASPPTG
ncbi:hypothetical protein BH23GEM2_BH23GEM2_13180 [soil metagenome]